MNVVGAASAVGTSVAIPAHQPGDLIVVSARRANNAPATIPAASATVPSWQTIQSAGSNGLALTTVYATASRTGHTTGAFTNAAHICVLVLRPDAGNYLAVGGSSSLFGSANQIIGYPALTLQKTDGTSWGVRAGTRTIAHTGCGTAPTNWTNQAAQPAGAAALMSMHTRASLTANPVQDNVATAGTNGPNRAHTVEVLERPLAKLETLQDTFDTTVDAAKWPGSYGGVAWDAAGRAKIPCTTAYPALATDPGAPGWDLTASYLFAQMTLPAVGAGTRETFVELLRSTQDKLSMWVSGTDLVARKTVAGANAGGASTPYNPAVHVWWRIREAGGTVYWDWSTDGLAWTNLYSTATPFAITRLAAIISSGYYGTEAAADTFVDNVNVAPGPPTATVAKRWDGAAWQTTTVRRWDGSAWQTATVKRRTASAWN